MTVKAAVPRHFSIVVFGLTQIALDLEVLWYLARWDPPLHRFWHTYLGATIDPMMLQIVCVLLGVIGLGWFFQREMKTRKASKGLHGD